MDAYYFKEHISEELEGAEHYIEMAMECKADGLSWSKTFAEMSKTELEHAANLFTMFTEYYRQFDDKPDLISYMEPFRNQIVDDYMKRSSEVKYMHEMYSKA